MHFSEQGKRLTHRENIHSWRDRFLHEVRKASQSAALRGAWCAHRRVEDPLVSPSRGTQDIPRRPSPARNRVQVGRDPGRATAPRCIATCAGSAPLLPGGYLVVPRPTSCREIRWCEGAGPPNLRDPRPIKGPANTPKRSLARLTS